MRKILSLSALLFVFSCGSESPYQLNQENGSSCPNYIAEADLPPLPSMKASEFEKKA